MSLKTELESWKCFVAFSPHNITDIVFNDMKSILAAHSILSDIRGYVRNISK